MILFAATIIALPLWWIWIEFKRCNNFNNKNK